MTLTRAAPGAQLSVGRLRVDAAKAIAKLREYQLADRTAWVLEAIRAAVASGATRIQLSGDANDVWLAWEGPAISVDDLPKLFDELVSPEPTELTGLAPDELASIASRDARLSGRGSRHHLRLLAAAVNSALGMNPAYVDVFAIGESSTVRARYTPDVLEEERDGESALRKVAAAPADAPAKFVQWAAELRGDRAAEVANIAPSSGMLVHLRRRAALRMLTYLFWEREPPELAVVRAACRDIAVPLHIKQEILHRDRNANDLVRLPLGDGLDGFVALVDPTISRGGEHAALMDVAERGVVLATYTIPLGPTEPRGPVPLRLFVDAARMPTNASRSQVRRESHPIAPAVERAPALAKQLIETLAKQLTDGTAPEKAREAALAIIAAEVAGPAWMDGLDVGGWMLGPLGAVALAKDATGAPQPLARTWQSFVYTGREAQPAELAPWLGDVMWAPPGDPIHRLFRNCDLDPNRMRRHLRRARRQRRDQRRFLERAPRTLVVAQAAPARVRMPLNTTMLGTSVASGRFVGFAGEVCLYPRRSGGDITLLFDGREIERVHVDTLLGFEAIIDSKRFTPNERYRGVEHDDVYDKAIFAAKGAAVRAAEALAIQLAGRKPPDGFEVAPRTATDHDEETIQNAIELALELDPPLGKTLASAPVWRTLGERKLSVDDLRALQVIGVAPAGVEMRAVQGRTILTGGSRELIAKLAPKAYIVTYSPFRARGAVSADELAIRLATKHRNALAIQDNEMFGAIAACEANSTLQLFHTGLELDVHAYNTRLLPACHISVDSDAIVPDDDWRTTIDDAGLRTCDFLPWEQRWVLAAAQALAGEIPPEMFGLTGLDDLTLESTFGRAFCHAIVIGDCKKLVGPELMAKLRTRRLVYVHGTTMPVTIDSVREQFPSPESIPYVERSVGTPVEGYAPLVASVEIARAIGVLAERRVVDGHTMLELKRRTIVRKARLAAHRDKPERGFAAPVAPHVTLDPKQNSLQASGFVAVGWGQLETKVFIEKRLFTTITRRGELPLLALVELDVKQTDAMFEGISDLIADKLFDMLAAAAPGLVVQLAKTQPTSLADPGVTLALLAAMFERKLIDRDTRKLLCDTILFPSVRGDRTTLEAARDPYGAISTAEWEGEWLTPASGEPVDSLDRAILRVPGSRGELHEVIDALNGAPALDVTDEIERLQRQRRMSRGLIPVPTLPHVPASLKRKLVELGDVGKRLGHGEIGLVESTLSTAIVHELGVPRDRIRLDVLPAIELAIEMPELLGHKAASPAELPQLAETVGEQLAALRVSWSATIAKVARAPEALSAQAQSLAGTLVDAVIATVPHEQLSPGIRRALRGSVLGWRIPDRVVSDLPIFETLDDTWIAWRDVAAQIQRFGDCWAVVGWVSDRPLDPARIVLSLSAGELAVARNRLAIIDATHELALDAKARRNRARPKVDVLMLYHREDVLAETLLDGDGVTGPRGVVGVLSPEAVERRGLYAHRELFPFEVATDPCLWPTVAVVEDARLEPDRTWERAKPGNAWADVVAAVRAASERAAATMGGGPPPSALATLHVTGALQSTVPALHDSRTQVRGQLWLVGAPRGLFRAQIDVYGVVSKHYTAPDSIAMGGSLFVYGDCTHSQLGELCSTMYGRMVRELARDENAERDLVGAHVAHALAIEAIRANDVRAFTFTCFRPKPINAVSLLVILQGKTSYRVLELDELDGYGVIDDGSETSRVIIDVLGSRARRGIPLPPPPPPKTESPFAAPPARVHVERPTPAPTKPLPKPPPRHAIQDLVDAVQGRMSAVGAGLPTCKISARSKPLACVDSVLHFSEDNRRLRAIANALRSKSPWAQLAIDALVAHATTLLNTSNRDVTDATEAHVLTRLLKS